MSRYTSHPASNPAAMSGFIASAKTGAQQAKVAADAPMVTVDRAQSFAALLVEPLEFRRVGVDHDTGIDRPSISPHKGPAVILAETRWVR
jgi:hypothetical protein